MALTDFLVDVAADIEYRYRVLVYPNITYQKDLMRDSYIIVMQNALAYLTAAFPQVYWVLVLPEHVPALDFPNTEQRILPMPTYPNTMRTHFDVPELSTVVNWREEDWDIVYSHLPEHTAQLANLFYNGTHLRPKFIGYCHWFEVPENTAYEKTMLWANLAGLLEMQECGVNSQWLKTLMIGKFAKMVTPEVLKRVDHIIQPHYLGVGKEEIRVFGRTPTQRYVIFNHRPNEYTGWNWFVQAMDKLWEKRQDFVVYTTLAGIDRPWCQQKDFGSDRQLYLDFLHTTPQFGVGCFEKYSAWSLATTDGLSQGVPYLLPDKLCYPEMLSSYPLLYSDRVDFIKKFERLLDNPEFTVAANIPKFIASVQGMAWESKVSQWFSGWSSVFDLSGDALGSKTDAYKRIVSFIETNRSVTKKDIIKHLNWGVGIPWSPYRNLLRQESHIRFTKNRYEVRNT